MKYVFSKWFVSEYTMFKKVDISGIPIFKGCLVFSSGNIKYNSKKMFVVFQFHSEIKTKFTIEVGFSDGEDIPGFSVSDFEIGKNGMFRICRYLGTKDYWWNTVTNEKLRIFSKSKNKITDEWVYGCDADEAVVFDALFKDITYKLNTFVFSKINMTEFTE